VTRVIRWWLSAPMSAGSATAIVIGIWLALAALIAIPVAIH